MEEAATEPAAEDPWHWHNLPEHVVERVFSFLSWEDRHSMSLVCETWNRTFHSSTSGMTFRYAIGEPDASRHLSLFETARVHCGSIRELEVEAPEGNFPRESVDRWFLWLRYLLFRLKRSPLTKVSFLGLNDLFYDAAKKISVHRFIVDFLEQSPEISEFRINGCFYEYEHILMIANALFGRDLSPKIKILHLESHPSDISQRQCDVPTRNVMLSLLFEFDTLTDLAIDYSLVLGNRARQPNILLVLTSPRNLKTLSINLPLSRFSAYFKIFDTNEWYNLKYERRDLVTSLHLSTTSTHVSQVEKFIVQETPLTNASYTFLDESGDSNPGDFLQKLSNGYAYESLEILDFDLANSKVPSLYSLLDSFLHKCQKLKDFSLYTEYPPRYLNALLNALLQTPIASLNHIYLRVNGIKTTRSLQHLEQMIFEYKQRFIALNLTLKADLLL